MIALLALANAAPVLDVHAWGELGATAPGPAAGLGVSVERRLLELGPVRSSIAPRLDLGWPGVGTGLLELRFGGRGDGRFWAGVGGGARVALSGEPGMGALDTWAVGHLGAGLVAPVSRKLGLTFELRATALRGDQGWAGPGVNVAVGLWPHAQTALVVAAPVPESEPEPEPVALSVRPGDAQIWVPHPWCRWVTVEELTALLPSLPPDLKLRVVRGGFLPSTVAQDVGEVTLQAAPKQGTLMVVGAKGDVLTLNGQPITLGADGVAQISLPEGPVVGTLLGGGRQASIESYVVDGFSAWVRASPPPPPRISFTQGSAEVPANGRAIVGQLASLRGEWRYTVTGSSSAEGDPEANRLLAMARAEAVAEALRRAGVPEGSITVLGASPPPADALVVSAQRVVVIGVAK